MSTDDSFQYDRFVFRGTVFVAVHVLEGHGCEDCCCLPYDSDLCNKAGLCTSRFRNDKRSVIWTIDYSDKKQLWAARKIMDLRALVNKDPIDD